MPHLPILPEMLVSCATRRFEPHKVLWADMDYFTAFSKHPEATCKGDIEAFIAETYCVGIVGSECFSDITFLPQTEAIASAERYGGYGLAGNGGGVRAVNVDGLQAKGVGVNQLIGGNVLEGYSSGTLNIIEGVTEILFSRVLNRIFPVGAVRTLGLIVTRADLSQYKNNEVEQYANGVPCWGAILLREPCVRPAHLMRAMFYQVAEPHKHRLTSDVGRTRKVNKAFKDFCGSDKGFVSVLADFLKSSANQFAFAKICRFTHGAATASNLAFDGRWLDLPLASFLPSNKNYRPSVNQVPFFTEHNIIDPTIVELVYTYCKYNNVHIEPAPLLDYYHRLYNQYLHSHSSWLFGIQAPWWPKKGTSKLCDNVTGLALETMLGDGSILWGMPYEKEQDDPVIRLLYRLFGSLTGQGCDSELWLDTEKQLQEVIVHSEFKRLLERIYDSNKENIGGSITSFLIASALRSLKRAHFSSYFYGGRIQQVLEAVLETGDPDGFAQVISSFDEASAWIFNDIEERVYLFKSSQAGIWWCLRDEAFYCQRSSGKPFVPVSPNAFIEECEPNVFVVDSYDFKTPLQEIGAICQSLTTFGSGESTTCERQALP